MAVIATLSSGRVQVGTGFLLRPDVVLTAGHCARDKKSGEAAVNLQLVRASDGAATEGTGGIQLLHSRTLDVAVLRLADPPWPERALPPVGFARVNRNNPGVLSDCVAVGYPLFQYDPASGGRETAELHGVIYQTDGAETGRLLMREPLLSGVTAPPGASPGQEWGGLSGALVFHHGRAIGMVIEHHPRQGPSAVQLLAFDLLAKVAETDAGTAAIAAAIGLPALDGLAWAQAAAVPALTGLVTVLADGDLPRLGTLNPYRLGASVSDYGNSESHGRDDPYVPRTHGQVDDRLRAALEPGRLVLVVGPSKAGKTRTAFEAALARWPDASLAAPAPGQLTALAGHPRLQVSSDPMLIWLDDLQRYLTGADPLTTALLTRLTARPGPTVLLATLRQEERDKLRQDTGEFAVDTRAVLDLADPTTFQLDHTNLDPAEQAAAAAAYPGTNLGAAGLAEALAHAPALLDAYRDSAAVDPVRHAVVRVVIDWTRAGLLRPVPEPTLVELTREVLWNERPDLDIDEARVTGAIGWARTALPGTGRAALLLTQPLAGRTRGYRPFDYLTAADNGQDGHPRPIPEPFWDQVLSLSSPEEAGGIGDAAYYRHNNRVALAALQKAADAGDTDALRRVGYLRAYALQPRDLDGARAAYQQAADAGNIDAAFNLGNLLARHLDPPDLDGARVALQQAADAGHTDALVNLGILLATRLDPPDLDGARAAYRRAADAGNTNALVNLGNLLADQQDPPDLDGARAAYQQAADAGNTDALFNLGILLDYQLSPPDLDGARTAYQLAAEAGNTGAALNLGILLANRLDTPDLDGARAAYQQAADAGSTDAAFNLGNLLAIRLDPPDVDGARAAYLQAVEGGSTNALINLGNVLAEQLNPPDLAGARAAYQQAAEAGNTTAAINLGNLLADRLEVPDLDGARAAYQQAADAGRTEALINLGNLLADRLDPPDLDGARAAYQQAVDAGHAEALVNLGNLLAEQLDPPDLDGARAAYQQAADAGSADAALNLGKLLAEQLDPPDLDGACAAYRQAAEAGKTSALVSLGILLATGLDPPDLDGARAAYQQAADAGSATGAFNLGLLLADWLDPPDLDGARAAYQQAADAGDTAALVNLGLLLAEQQDPPDLDGARAAYQQAADAGDTLALLALGNLLSDRLDPPDLQAARAAFRQAADGGSAEALLELGALEARAGDTAATAAAWQAAVDTADETVIVPAAVNLAAVAAAAGETVRAEALLRQAAAQGSNSALDYLAALNPLTRAAACARLAKLPDTDSLNFRGLAAHADGDCAQARRLWSASQDQQDVVAPLLLRILCLPNI